jgi:hypothetical protein
MLSAKQGKCEVPKGPQGQKRPADVNRNAVLIARIAMGEAGDDVASPGSEGKNPAAVILGRMGGVARARGMSAKKRREIAKKAAKARWFQK